MQNDVSNGGTIPIVNIRKNADLYTLYLAGEGDNTIMVIDTHQGEAYVKVSEITGISDNYYIKGSEGIIISTTNNNIKVVCTSCYVELLRDVTKLWLIAINK